MSSLFFWWADEQRISQNGNSSANADAFDPTTQIEVDAQPPPRPAHKPQRLSQAGESKPAATSDHPHDLGPLAAIFIFWGEIVRAAWAAFNTADVNCVRPLWIEISGAAGTTTQSGSLLLPLLSSFHQSNPIHPQGCPLSQHGPPRPSSSCASCCFSPSSLTPSRAKHHPSSGGGGSSSNNNNPSL